MARVRIELRLGFGVRAAIITEPATMLMVTAEGLTPATWLGIGVGSGLALGVSLIVRPAPAPALTLAQAQAQTPTLTLTLSPALTLTLTTSATELWRADVLPGQG